MFIFVLLLSLLSVVCTTNHKSFALDRSVEKTFIVSVYVDEFSIICNAKKSIFLIFKGRECVEVNDSMCMCVNGDKIEKSECADHLVHRISTNDKSAIANFWMYFNMFMFDFGHTYSFVKSKLFKKYCCSFYGAPLWFLY